MSEGRPLPLLRTLLKTALLIDTESIYNECKKRFGKRLSYPAFVEKLKSDGHDLLIKIAYGNQKPMGILKKFLTQLQELGFQINFEYGKDWHIELILHSTSFVYRGLVDCVILATSNPIYEPLIPWLQGQGVKVHVYSCNIPKALFQHTLATEISRDLMYDPLATTQQVELPANVSSDGSGPSS